MRLAQRLGCGRCLRIGGSYISLVPAQDKARVVYDSEFTVPSLTQFPLIRTAALCHLLTQALLWAYRMNDRGKGSCLLFLFLFRRLRALNVAPSDLSLPLLPPLRPQLQDRVHPSTLIALSWRGREGHTPGWGLGTSGAYGPIVPFPDVCSGRALSNKRSGLEAPMGAERMFMHLQGSG